MTPYLQNKILFPPYIQNKPSLNLGLIIVIPCYDEDFLLLTLLSLKKCELPDCDVEVIVVINNSETDTKLVKNKNLKTYEQASEWAKKNNITRLKFHIIYADNLGKKHAGVGLARKIGMDEACWRLEKIRNPRGIIVGFDADSRCGKNYFSAIENYFRAYKRKVAASIHYEHPLQGVDFEENIYEAITLYELHLRYYVEAKRWSGFPFATQTIGSSMAVRCNAYQKQGGMNKRKAGEDFYFLHKFTQLGNFGEITTTTVIPSPRISTRVPFGTGKAVGEIVENTGDLLTYNPKSFQDLKIFFSRIKKLYQLEEDELVSFLKELPLSISSFLQDINFDSKILEIQSNTNSYVKFKNRFFRWFNAFMIMKYLHFSRDHFYENVDVEEAAKWLLMELNKTSLNMGTAKEMLIVFRNMVKE